MEIKVGHIYVAGKNENEKIELPPKAKIDHIEFDQGDYHIIFWQAFNEHGDLI